MAYRRRKKRRSGQHCVRRKRVHVRGRGMALRCAKYSGKKRGAHRRCKAWGVNRRGVRVCRSFGKKYGGKYKNRRRSMPGYGPMLPGGTFFSV